MRHKDCGGTLHANIVKGIEYMWCGGCASEWFRRAQPIKTKIEPTEEGYALVPFGMSVEKLMRQ